MIGPLSLDPLIRETWGAYDPLVLAQLAPLAYEVCYQPKFYRVPDPQNEIFGTGAYLEFGLEVPPGDLLFGFLIPANPVTGVPGQFTFQLEDLSTGHKFWDEPIPSVLLANYHPTVLDAYVTQMGCFWNLLNSPYPVVGSGRFRAQIQNTTDRQRIEVVIGALEVVECN
jgi:hypothetical protein